MKKIQRCDLDRCYSFGEYNKTIDYGEKNSHLTGVSNCIEQLNNAKNHYMQEMETVINEERDIENRKYRFWEKWHRIKILAPCIWIGSFLINKLSGKGYHSLIVDLLLALLIFTALATFLLFLLAIIMEIISRKLYLKYIDSVWGKFNSINNAFENTARKYYQSIDDIYLNSLEPAYREMVLMRREQQEHQRRLEQIAEEQRRLEAENLAENRRIRNTQEELLGIEREREKRYRGW